MIHIWILYTCTYLLFDFLLCTICQLEETWQFMAVLLNQFFTLCLFFTFVPITYENKYQGQAWMKVTFQFSAPEVTASWVSHV